MLWLLAGVWFDQNHPSHLTFHEAQRNPCAAPVQPQCSPSAVLVQFQCSPSTIAPALGGIDGHTGTTCLGSKRSHQGDNLSENITAVL